MQVAFILASLTHSIYTQSAENLPTYKNATYGIKTDQQMKRR